MSGWRVIDLSSCSATLRVRRGQLEVQTERDSRCIPSRDVAVLLVGHGVSLGPSVVQHCAVHDVTLLAVDWKGVPVSAQQVWSTNTRVGARQLAVMSREVVAGLADR
ncbi:hypothetical protein BJF82_07605 [Kytococcus sp. CUA-901]|nr:hypothetical protein BJF82_07605 [Kytococcus sp. CUA-901]